MLLMIDLLCYHSENEKSVSSNLKGRLMIKTLLIIVGFGLLVVGGAYFVDQALWRMEYHVDHGEEIEPGVVHLPSFEELQRRNQALTDRLSPDLELMEYPDKIRILGDLIGQQNMHTVLLFGSFT